MGMGMLNNLKNGGFDAQGFDIRPLPGIETSIDTFCDGLETLITVVRDADETDALLFDTQAVIARAQTLKTIIISSTLSPHYVMGLRTKIPAQITLIDAPMSGAQIKADAGTLTFMTGGDTTKIKPLLETMGRDIHHMGDFGAGMTAKVLNNLLAASHTAMTRLVLDWADAAGVAEDKLLRLIHTASGQNWFASGFNDIEFTRDGYTAGNTIDILVKDVGAALDIAQDTDTTLPTAIRDTLRQLAPRDKP